MTTRYPHLTRFWPLYLIGIVAAAALVMAKLLHGDPQNPFDWPSWTQAIGSIAAILVAVWVSADQASHQRERDAQRERAEISGVLRSLRAEVNTTFSYLQSQVAPSLADRNPDQPLRSTFSLPEYPFPIFDSLIPKLGALSDARLQNQIIQTYAYARSLAYTIRTHDEMLKELEWAESQERTNPAADIHARPKAHSELVRYGNSLAQSYELAIQEIRHLSDALSAACPDE